MIALHTSHPVAPPPIESSMMHVTSCMAQSASLKPAPAMPAVIARITPISQPTVSSQAVEDGKNLVVGRMGHFEIIVTDIT